MNFVYAALIMGVVIAIKIGSVVFGIAMGGIVTLVALYILVKFLRTEIPDEPERN